METAAARTLARLPELPDTYVAPAQQAMLQVETLPGYHASLWNDNDLGFARMKAAGVLPADAGCPYIPEHERKRLRVGFHHGFLCLGDLVIGIETDNHYAQRLGATVETPAREQLRHLPVAPEGATKGEATYAQTTRMGVVPVIRK
jgi:hypothetical protein